ncbi:MULTISPECIES: peptidylprolyl isomerase [Marinobacter]|mgnify:FL=1|jgi:peptidyl-prolyl cis-trans isomerase SurA|uniref:Chaperone SurA n=1 Tax=Marinobacter manganoxydans MnI7-9 TaxID=1094979 RepID=G6YTZ1_9GAMM|nr:MULTISPECIES: peptidylprolyl isomerase [Marinobacter]MCP4066405.1 molecular chaperone SurA [Gammaproteobacteria bacterium]HAP51628.1 molecular chaperone SurA [Marinobacter adhaerens]AKV95904.1 molecular chaperone SurA [Marinobacter sp. CP1]EHJ04280.1 PpiC-type peptidyl-prolyl cis-trans isomerase [Marinobacter manganoxydans MnI7-9]MAK50228.1 molecular chaperone SurA [Marinobacter sp.]|tara:strand:- start:5247 stop:6587 length:1341 start_codon:yes stop_codon:yes gene_type:complete
MKATLRHGVQALLVLLAVLAPLSVQAERKLLDQVVAIVDEDVILQTELEARINTITSRLSAQGTALPPRQVLEERVLDQLITESIQMQMADRAGMRISDNELNETMANIAERNGMSLPQFEIQLEAEGVTYNQAREQIRKEMLTSRVQQRQVGNRVRVTDREVENYLESLEARGGNNAQYRLAYIFVSVDDPSDEAEVDAAREKAERLRSEIANGRDFREVAVAESDASNALEGGDMGWRAEGQLPSLVAPVVPELPVGEPSDVLENNSGFHLVMVMDKRGGEQQQMIQQHRVRHILVRPSEATTDSQAETVIRDLYQQLQNGASFSALAREYSDDPVSGSDGGNLGWVSPGQMVPAFEQAMLDADIGELRGPFRSQFGWHILQVQERRQKDISGDVRDAEARQAIYRRKFETELQNWLQEIRDEAFVEFKGEYAKDEPAEEEPVS